MSTNDLILFFETIESQIFKHRRKPWFRAYIKDLFSNEEWEKLPDKYKIDYSYTIKEYYKNINDWTWLIVIGLIHDLGKVLVLPDFGAFPEYFSVGDIYPLGCKFQETNISWISNS